MYLQRKAGVTICGRYDIVALFALVGRCVALQECGWVTVALRRFVGGFGPLFGAPKAEQEKSIGAFLRQCRSRQPAVRTATRVCGILKMALIIEFQMCFGAILCKNARQPRVYKAFGTRRKEV